MKIHTLGTSHGATEPGRSCSANLFEINGSYYLFDCGADVEKIMTDMRLPQDKIRAVFVSHMHTDHTVSIPSVVKRFSVYMSGRCVQIFLPEQKGIDGLKSWLGSLHFNISDEVVKFGEVTPDFVYTDENITVTVVPTRHIEGGKYPSYAYIVKTADQRVLYTGDLSADFSDYPAVLSKEHFDAVLCELTHFNFDDSIDIIKATKTDKMIFTHIYPSGAAEKAQKVNETVNFDIFVAEDGNCYEI